MYASVKTFLKFNIFTAVKQKICQSFCTLVLLDVMWTAETIE
jgi:hypothetical protein